MTFTNTSTFELLSTNMYYVKASLLECELCSKTEDDLEYAFVKINPTGLESVSLNNNRLTVGSRIYGGREFIEKRGILNKDETNALFSEFRGTIIGYPYYSLSVDINDEIEPIECDAIRIKGGFKNKFPYFGYCDFLVDLIAITGNGKVESVKSYCKEDIGKMLKIRKKPKVGQIVGTKNSYSPFLNPSDFVDFINGVKTSYMGQPNYEWAEIRGNINSDSSLTRIWLKIDLEAKIISFSYHENLYQRTYKVLSHSSMDPGYDECTKSKDRYFWAHLAFDENSLINLITTLAKNNLVDKVDSNFINFTSSIKKSDFFRITGVKLSEAVVETCERY